MMATIIKVDGTTEESNETSLVELQKAVGGYIEALNLGRGKYMVVNEEGALMGLPINKAASAIWGRGPIVGDVVICTKNEL